MEKKKPGRKAGSFTGPLNPRWNGGVSEYPHHDLLKKRRIAVLEKAHWICASCGGAAKETHHIDGGKVNHNGDNLTALCHACHMSLHAGRKNKTSRFRDKYGFTLQEIANQSGLSVGTVYNHLKENRKPPRPDARAKINAIIGSAEKLEGGLP